VPPGLVTTRRAWGSYLGAPVYDGTAIEPLITDGDGRVMLGLGPSGGSPVAWVLLCPCDGVDGIVRDLQEAAAIAAEHHPPHDFPMAREAET